jgi:hypothetical protein
MGIHIFNRLPSIIFIEMLSAVQQFLHGQRQANRRTGATSFCHRAKFVSIFTRGAVEKTNRPMFLWYDVRKCTSLARLKLKLSTTGISKLVKSYKTRDFILQLKAV